MFICLVRTMPRNFFIIGTPKVGKTTLLWKVIEELKNKGLKVGGFVSPEEKHHGTRTAFHVVDIKSNKEKLLASVKGDGPKISKYHVNIKSFESIAVPSMKNVNKYDIFVIDEIGRMEMKSTKFVKLLDKVFDSDTPVIAAIHKDYLDEYNVMGQVYQLRFNNQEESYKKIITEIEKYLGNKMRKKAAGKKMKKKVVKKKTGKSRKVKPAIKKTKKKTVAKKTKKAEKKKPRKRKKEAKKMKKKEQPKTNKEKTTSSEHAKKKALEELKYKEKEEEEDKGFVETLKDLLGF